MMDLVERQRINRIERQLTYLYEHLGLYPGAAESVHLPVPPEVYEHARSGNRLRAVKAYCEATGADLAAGNAFVEALARG
jgi:hypothetical protein